MIRGHLNKDLGSFRRGDVLLTKDPPAGIERKHSIANPGLATFFILAQSELDLVDDLIGEAVFDGLVRGHVEVAIGIVLDLLKRLTRGFGENGVELVAEAFHLLRLDMNIHGHGHHLAGNQWLVNEDT